MRCIAILAAVLVPACSIGSSANPPPPRSFQNPGPSNEPPRSCVGEVDGDACTVCQQQSCCDEISRCNADSGHCRDWYASYHDCLYPDDHWSGFSRRECQLETDIGGNPAALALITCFNAHCAGDDTCGAEPRNVFSFPPPAPVRDFSAALFFESYCNGCHAPGRVGPTGDLLSVFTSNTMWQAPCADPGWFTSMDYATIKSKVDIIACGVRADTLSAECASLPTVRPGFFTKPAKFPPSGIGGYASCPFTTSNGGCPQPTLYERARLLSWISEGAPE